MAQEATAAERSRAAATAVQPIQVKVYAQRVQDSDGDVLMLFNHTWQTPGSAKHKGRIQIDEDAPATPIHFHLFGEQSSGLEFMDPAVQAMWVDLTKCPTQADPTGGGQITYIQREPRLLRVEDANAGDECTIHFALRFRDGAGAVFEYDPEIQNGGGNNL